MSDGPLLFDWWRAVDVTARADTSPDRPSIKAITLIAHHRGLHADSDGTRCYPAQSTLARLAEVERPTVRKVDDWLMQHKLMEHVRNHERGLREYKLTIPPDGSLRHHLDPVDDAADGRDADHLNPPPPVDNDPDGGEADHLPEGQKAAEPTTCTPGHDQMEARCRPDGRPADHNRTPDTELRVSSTTHSRAAGERDDESKIDQVLDALVDHIDRNSPGDHTAAWRRTVRAERRQRHGAELVRLVRRHNPDTPNDLIVAALLGEPALTLRHHESHDHCLTCAATGVIPLADDTTIDCDGPHLTARETPRQLQETASP